MIEPKFVEWMNMELDGVLPQRDQESLREHLSSDPEAAQYFEGLRAAVGVVDGAGSVDPPAHLEEHILAAVPFGLYVHPSPAHNRVGWREKLFILPRYRYAAVFAFGIVFGLLVYSAINYDTRRGGAELDINDFLGTMKHITSSDGFRQTRTIGVDLDQVRGSVSLHESDEVLLADIALNASGEIEWVVEYNEGDVSLDGYRSINGGGGAVHAADSEMRVQQSGDTRYLLFFTRRDHPVTPFVVKIYSADHLLLEQNIIPAAKSAR